MIERILHNWPAKVLSIGAAFLLFLFTNVSQLEERYVTVPLDVRLNSTMAVSASIPSTVRIGIRGDQELISALRTEQFIAYVDLNSIDNPGTYERPVEAELVGEAAQLDSLEIRVEPYELKVQLEERVQRRIEIIPQFSGEPAYGYELGRTVLQPSMVEIQGPESVVSELRAVRTEAVSLSGRRDDFDVRVRVIRPNLFVRFSGIDIVDIRGVMQAVVSEKQMQNLSVQLSNLAEGMRLSSVAPSGSLSVRGELLVLEDAENTTLQLRADASGIRFPGEYSLPVVPLVPENVEVLSYEPRTIDVVIERSGNVE